MKMVKENLDKTDYFEAIVKLTNVSLAIIKYARLNVENEKSSTATAFFSGVHTNADRILNLLEDVYTDEFNEFLQKDVIPKHECEDHDHEEDNELEEEPSHDKVESLIKLAEEEIKLLKKLRGKL